MKENIEKRCIYHVPNYINPKGNSGSSIRPQKMLQAFKNIGYNVDVVMGYAKDRKKQINRIKDNIKKGIKYEFMYSESSTMPTLLTEKNHLPTHPFLDFGFMKFCKKNNIKIGLYYRDIYWRFPYYRESVNNTIKRNFAIFMYNYDFYKYNKLLDYIYIQSLGMKEYFPKNKNKMNVGILPPGCEKNEKLIWQKKAYLKNVNTKNINIFYVGGIGRLYNIENLLKIANKKEFLNLTICCRKDEWDKEYEKYKGLLCPRITIVHAHSSELEKYYKDADICSIYFPQEEYRNFVMPIKLFEYIGNVTPIIATANTATGNFVEENDIGWAIANDNELEDLFEKIYNNREELLKKYYNLEKVLESNTWEKRAQKVADDLKD